MVKKKATLTQRVEASLLRTGLPISGRLHLTPSPHPLMVDSLSQARQNSSSKSSNKSKRYNETNVR